MDIITVNDLTFFYPESPRPALSRLSLSVRAGEFLVLCGPSGCGKSTLLRHLKPQLTPHGVREGSILLEGVPLGQLPLRQSAAEIGFVHQSPDHQLVTDKVWHELAFGLESLGLDTPTIRRRVAEMAAFFGIQDWFYRDVGQLSGGQKQLLNLAAVMVMQPRVLVLDEPTSQLDPITAGDFLAVLKKLNRELGTTIILSEHRLAEALPLADRAAVLDGGRLLTVGSVAEVGRFLRACRHPMFLAMPAATRIWGAVESESPCPVTVNEGRRFLAEYTQSHPLRPLPPEEAPPCGSPAVSAHGLWFRYEKEGPDVLRQLELEAHAGELFCILGGNGAGKSTLLKVLAGRRTPYRGSVECHGTALLLPQNPQTLFACKTVAEELRATLEASALSKAEQSQHLGRITALCRLGGLEQRHPFDLSGGEQQRLALAKLLLLGPDILLLDEPTKGLDAGFKQELAQILRRLTAAGVCVIMVSHDVEFCADHAHRCALFFDGSFAAEGTPRQFFAGNSFYTTSANRIARGLVAGAVSAGDVIRAIGGTELLPPPPADDDAPYIPPAPPVKQAEQAAQKPLPLWRKLAAGGFGAAALAIFWKVTQTGSLNQLLGSGGISPLGRQQLLLYGGLVVCLVLLGLCIGRRSAPPLHPQPPKEQRRLSRRTRAAVAVVVLLVPLTLFVGAAYLEAKHYAAVALAILVECMLPFLLIFEGRRPKTRELVLIAALCALGTAGRAAFFMLPQFKPVLALVILVGVSLGAESGFLVGAVTMLLSNILFSQGPWTPWQMFAMGAAGFLAGVLFRKGWLRRTTPALCLFGAFAALVLYGGIMNFASALIWNTGSLTPQMLAAYYITGFPMDCVHAAATVLFLWFLAQPLLQKLERIKEKYGLMG